jgi:protein O-mannosyl-transferase
MAKLNLRGGLPLVVLAVLVFVVYWPALSADFIYLDDTSQIVGNKTVTGGVTWQGLADAFKPYASLWTPLTWISHMLVVEFAGLDPKWHHLVNIALHAVAVLLLFSWVRRATKGFWVALAVAALFAVHPLNVENVVWVTERNHLLAITFLLLGFHAYSRHVAERTAASPSRAGLWMRLTELAMLLSVMSKGVFLTFPALLLILDAWLYRRFEREGARRLIVEKAGLFAIALFSMFMTMRSLELQASSGDALSLPFRACVALTTLGWQAFRIAIPYELSPIHPLPREILWQQAMVSAAGLILAVYIGWRARKRMPWLLAGIAWFVIALAPVSGITQAGNTFFGDRFVYLPQIGIFLAVGLSTAVVLSRMRYGTSLGLAVLAVLVAVYGFISHSYARLWKDTATLFTYAAAVTEDNFIAHTTAALALVNKNDIQGAIPHYEAGLRINPGAVNFRIAYGDALTLSNRSADAAVQLESVLATDPGNAGAQFRLANTQLRLGRAREALSNFESLKARKVNAPDLDQWIQKAAAQAARELPPEVPPPSAVPAR